MMDDTGHLPPQNLEAEEALLGAMMMSGKAIEAAEEQGVVVENFYRPSHRMIFEAIGELRERGSVDELTTINRLKARKQLKEVGGGAAVMSLAERCPAVANARAYAEEVVLQALKRRVVELGHEAARVGYDMGVDADDTVKQVASLMLDVVTANGRKHERGESIDGDESVDRWAAAYERRSDHELLEQDTLSWGRPELDERLGRMRAGAVFVPAGWTKHGKTWWCLEVAEAVMEQGHRVLFDSGEMSDEELLDRWTAMQGHNLTALEEGRIPWSVLAAARKRIARWKRRTLQGRMTMARLRSQVSRAKLEGRPYRLVVVDHLGLVRPGPGEGRNGRREFVEDFVAEFKSLAEEYGFTGLLVSQLSRPSPVKEAHERYLRPPIQSDLKEASGIEQIATSVIFVYRLMDKTKGRYIGQSAVLLFPFHRSRQTPERLSCEFVLPGKTPGVPAYRFVPTEPEEPEPASAEVVAVQQSLTDAFGPGVMIVPDPVLDDDIPF